MADMIKVLLVRPMRRPYPVEVENTLCAMQELVGGYIETIGLGDAILVCNEEGRIIPLAPNRELKSEDGSTDLIHGPFFVCGSDGDEFTSLSDDLMISYGARFWNWDHDWEWLEQMLGGDVDEDNPRQHRAKARGRRG